MHISEESEAIRIAIYENDVTDDYVNISGKTKMIIEKIFYLKEIKQRDTPMDVSINRDMDGLISIIVNCGGQQQIINVNAPKDIIDDITKANIEHSLSLM